LKRGPISGFEMTNVKCTILSVSTEAGLAGAVANPGSLRAATIFAVNNLLRDNMDGSVNVLEPLMKVEVIVKEKIVGTVLSDFTNKRGNVRQVCQSLIDEERNVVKGDIPLKSILGYATSLRSLTGGEAQFTAEYLGHAPRSD